jgi:predicted alpha/beta-fold hydrolase
MTDSAAAVDFLDVARFNATGWLANAHFQSIVPSLSLRRPWIARRAKQMLAVADTQIVDCGDGVRLLGHYSSQEAAGRPKARDLAILLHGWEGSSDSVYVLSLGSHLFSLAII